MGTELLSKDYITLLKEDIPNGRDDLINTSKSLEDVAQHCLDSYDKVQSLEQTVNYTAQALGSVAYKINLLASNFLEVLDQQNMKLNSLQTKVNHLNMQVKIHQEKTARLSIGKYTLPRDPMALRPSKRIEPIMEINDQYRRKEMDFTLLDNIGHGVKDFQLGGSTVAYNSISRHSSTSGTGSESQKSNYQHSQVGSLGPKGGSEYISKYGRSSCLPLNSNIGSQYRSPGTLLQRNQMPMVAPSLSCSTNIPSSPPISNYGSGINFQGMLTGGRRSNSVSTANSGTLSPGLQKQYQTPIITSPQKLSTNTTPDYGYPAMVHPMANIPPPPPPNLASQVDKSAASMNRFTELPPPPMEPQSAVYQSNINVLPPPPANAEQYNINNNNTDQVITNRNSNRINSELIPVTPLSSNPYDSLGHKQQPSDPSWVPSQYLCKVVTLYEYQQNKDDELNFQEHEIIYVVKKNNDGWWEGVMSSGTGLFPGNYVQEIN